MSSVKKRLKIFNNRYDPFDSFKQESTKMSMLFSGLGSKTLNHICQEIEAKNPYRIHSIEGKWYFIQTHEELAASLRVTREAMCRKINEMMKYGVLEKRKIRGFCGFGFRINEEVRERLNLILATFMPTQCRKTIKEIRLKVWGLISSWLTKKSQQVIDFIDKRCDLGSQQVCAQITVTPYIYKEKEENPPFSCKVLSSEDSDLETGSVSATEAIASPKGAQSLPETVALESKTAKQPAQQDGEEKRPVRTREEWDSLIEDAPSFLKTMLIQQRDDQYPPIKNDNIVCSVEIKPADKENDIEAYGDIKECKNEEKGHVFEDQKNQSALTNADLEKNWLETLNRQKAMMAKNADLQNEARAIGVQERLSRKLDAIKKRYQRG